LPLVVYRLQFRQVIRIQGDLDFLRKIGLASGPKGAGAEGATLIFDKRYFTSYVGQKELDKQTGNITIRALEQLGRKMNMKLVYGFVPMEGSLQKKIDHKAISVAKKIVMKTSGNMSLEAQNVSSAMLKKAINEKAKELRQKKLKWLWE